MVQYAEIYELETIIDFFFNNWYFYLDLNVINATRYLPFKFFENRFEEVLDESFRTRNYESFFALASYALTKKSINISKTYYLDNVKEINDLIAFSSTYIVSFDGTHDKIIFNSTYFHICNYLDYRDLLWNLNREEKLTVYKNGCITIYFKKNPSA